MATKYKESSESAFILRLAAEMGRNMREPMNDDWVDPVYRYVVRDIECTLQNDVLEFSFRNPGLAQQLSGGGLQAVINQLRTTPPNPPVARAAPLDIGAYGDPAYVFLRIISPINLTFSSGCRAITHKNPDDKRYYGGLRHVNAQDVSEDPLENCKIVYFVVDPIAPPTDDYKHGLNLNVELMQQVGAGGETRTIAFEIDPDVRYPGGSGF